MSRYDLAFEIISSNIPLPTNVTLNNHLVTFIWDMHCFKDKAYQLKESLCLD